MGLGIAIILILSGLLGIMIKLYEEHVDYLNKKIKDLQFKVDFTTECLDAHKEMVEDLEGYYEKWRETVADLDEAEQKIWELDDEIKYLENQIQFLQEYESEYR